MQMLMIVWCVDKAERVQFHFHFVWCVFNHCFRDFIAFAIITTIALDVWSSDMLDEKKSHNSANKRKVLMYLIKCWWCWHLANEHQRLNSQTTLTTNRSPNISHLFDLDYLHFIRNMINWIWWNDYPIDTIFLVNWSLKAQSDAPSVVSISHKKFGNFFSVVRNWYAEYIRWKA